MRPLAAATRFRAAMWRRIVSSAIVAAMLGVLALPASAGAFLYWANAGTNSIGRANVDGSGVNQSFISGLNTPIGVSVDSQHIFWANFNTNHIGRANRDGTGVNPNFIPVAGQPLYVASDGTHVYWSNQDTGDVGRANVDGSGVDDSLIPAPTFIEDAEGVAVDGSYVYWTQTFGNIGRANLDGTGPNFNFAPTPTFPEGVAVDAAHIYWADFGGGTGVGRASINGMDSNPSFIATTDPLHGIAVDGAHIFWANQNTSTIQRANLDGSDVTPSFIAATAPEGVAVDPLPSNEITFGKLKRNKRKGTARLSVEVKGPGVLELAGKGLVKQRPARTTRRARLAAKTVAAAGTVKLLIKAKGGKKRKLNRKGRVKVTANVTFTPTFGLPATNSRKIRLRKL
jgi:virginiamycin B lyase